MDGMMQRSSGRIKESHASHQSNRGEECGQSCSTRFWAKATCHGCGDDLRMQMSNDGLQRWNGIYASTHPDSRARRAGQTARQHERDSDAVTNTIAWKSLPLETL